MQIDTPLPDDVEALKRLVLEQRAKLAASTIEIDQLKLLIAKLRRMQFGRSSEKLSHEIDQLELRLEELQTVQAQAAPMIVVAQAGAEKPVRRPLPEHLPREVVVHQPACACPDCGGALRRIGEDVCEVLEHIPEQFKVVRHVRPKLSCVRCQRIVQVHAPSRPIARGMAGPGLLAHVLVSKYADHLPLYRQAQIYARQGITLDRSTLADWVGRAAFMLRPVHERMLARLKGSAKLFADETTAPVLDPGRGRTKTGQLWAYARDDRPWGGSDPPGVAYVYAPDRKAERPIAHLAGFKGIVQVDGYGGYRVLAEHGDVELAFCWSHVRRRFYELAATGSAPIASEALERLAGLYRIESEIRGLSADGRRTARREKSRPIITALEPWLRDKLSLISQKTKLAEAIRYALSRWEGLTRFLDDGRIEIDTNIVERAIRPIALNRKNALFAGSDGGGEHWAIIASLVETCKLNAIDPQSYLADVITRIVNGHPNSHIDELLPWAYAPIPDLKAVA